MAVTDPHKLNIWGLHCSAMPSCPASGTPSCTSSHWVDLLPKVRAYFMQEKGCRACLGPSCAVLLYCFCLYCARHGSRFPGSHLPGYCKTCFGSPDGTHFPCLMSQDRSWHCYLPGPCSTGSTCLLYLLSFDESHPRTFCLLKRAVAGQQASSTRTCSQLTVRQLMESQGPLPTIALSTQSAFTA